MNLGAAVRIIHKLALEDRNNITVRYYRLGPVHGIFVFERCTKLNTIITIEIQVKTDSEFITINIRQNNLATQDSILAYSSPRTLNGLLACLAYNLNYEIKGVTHVRCDYKVPYAFIENHYRGKRFTAKGLVIAKPINEIPFEHFKEDMSDQTVVYEYEEHGKLIRTVLYPATSNTPTCIYYQTI